MATLKAVLINTGTELLIGRVLNTHQQWIGRQLADLGYELVHQMTVQDRAHSIREAVKAAFGWGELVVVTGGLGPTSDDLTRPIIAEMVGSPLVQHRETTQRIKSFFQAKKLKMPREVLIQALVPENAVVLPNDHGTAPGLWMRVPQLDGPFQFSWLLMLPGPPRELYPMFSRYVVPLLEREIPVSTRRILHTFRTTGLGESRAAALIEQGLQEAVKNGLEIGYCARPGEVDVRLSMASNSDAFKQSIAFVGKRLKRWIFSHDENDTLEAVVVRELIEEKRTLSIAESCTGGHIANRITHVPGASKMFVGGIVAYSNEVKTRLLEVSPQDLERYGAVSEPVAIQMAIGVRRLLKTDFGLAVTGIAGPDGGTALKPVGTACIALADPHGTQVVTVQNPSDRLSFKNLTAQQALDLLRRNKKNDRASAVIGNGLKQGGSAL